MGVRVVSGAAGLASATPFTATAAVDPATSGAMTVDTYPDDQSALAIQVAGDAYPQVLITSKAADGIYLGDGTYDAYNHGSNIYATGTSGKGIKIVSNENAVHLTGATGVNIATGGGSEPLGFHGATPVVQHAAIGDATGGAIVDTEARTALNTLLASMRSLGLIAT